MASHLWREAHAIPGDWQFLPLRQLIDRMDAGSSPLCDAQPAKPGEWGVLKVSAVSWDGFDDRENKALPSAITPCLTDEVNVGDIVASRANTTELCGAVERVHTLYARLLLCDKTWRLHVRKYTDPDWLVAALKLPNTRRQIEAVATGTSDSMKNIAKRDFLGVHLPVPSNKEQRRIAEALGLAEKAIQRARAEMDATRELKRSLMNSLFTLGLPGRERTVKGSILGPIPEGWTVRTIKSALAEKPESGTSPLSRPDPPGTPILNVSCVKDGVCSPADVTYVDAEAGDVKRYRALAGDFFVLRGNGNRDYVATGGLLRQEPSVITIYSDKLIRLRFHTDIVAERFIPYLWQSAVFLSRLQSKAESSSGLWMISKRDVCRELFAYPPLDEQKLIVEILDGTEIQLSAQAAKLDALLQVRRSLSQHLLTGKIRIPEGAVHA